MRLRVAAFAAGLGVAAGAAAQLQLPPPADPSRIEERAGPQREAPRAPRLPEIPSPAPAAVPEALKALRITLREIRFEGATVVPQERLQARADRYLGREITGEDREQRPAGDQFRRPGRHHRLGGQPVVPQSLTASIDRGRLLRQESAITGDAAPAGIAPSSEASATEDEREIRGRRVRLVRRAPQEAGAALELGQGVEIDLAPRNVR